MNKIEELTFPIDRKYLFGVYIYLINYKLDILKKRIGIYYSSRDIYLENGKDLYYNTPDYIVHYSDIESRFDCDLKYFPNLKSEGDTQIVISNYEKLSSLLKFLGFNSKLSVSDLLDIKKNLFNGTFAYEHCNLFGYQKKPDKIWKNGILVPNPEIQNLSDYDIRKYEFVGGTGLQFYFHLLNEVDYRNPEAIFTPFEEEGSIKKRILTGSDENV